MGIMSSSEKAYKATLKELVGKYKTVIKQNFSIMDKEIDGDLSDDKMLNVLKAKELAGEQVKYYAKEIQKLESEINGEVAEVEVAPIDAARNSRKKYIR